MNVSVLIIHPSVGLKIMFVPVIISNLNLIYVEHGRTISVHVSIDVFV